MDDYKLALIVVGVILAFLAFTAWQIVSTEKRNRLRRSTKIDREWGELPDRTYSSEMLDSIHRAFVKKRDGGLKKRNNFTIDDITWNDLDMDQIFMVINNTQSSAGDEAVYQALRTPCFDEAELAKREQLATYFANHPEERKKMQMQLARLGRMKNYSMSDYIDIFLTLHAESNLTHYVPLVFMVIAIAIIPFSLGGVLALILIIGYNIVNYYKIKAKVEPFFVCVSYVVALVRESREIVKIFKDVPELKDYLAELDQASASMTDIVRKANWIGSGGAISDNPVYLILEYVKLSTHIDLIQFNSILNKVQMSTTQIQTMMDTIGNLELSIAIASFRELMPVTRQPEFVTEGEVVFSAEDLYHPLIKEPVANSITAARPVLLTGSNASGKSTFLKTVALNAILAQSIHTVTATAYRSSFFRVFSSMALRDNLEGEESYFMVEIRSLKRIVDASADREGTAPVLCFIDEVLRGTNTVERIAASSQIMKLLAESRCMCFAATHDVELTYMMERYYDNYHFREEIVEDDVQFNYTLYAGRSDTRNAIKLLKIMGYDDTLTEQAETIAEEFLETGVWKKA